MLEWLQHSRTGLIVDRNVLADQEPVHAPHLIDVEVANALRKQVRLGNMMESRAQQALWDLVHAPCIRHEHYPFLQRIWELRDNISPYDASYIALAEFLGATLLSCDGRLARAPGHRARIKFVS